MTTWFHFACHHSAESIDASGVLNPHPQPTLGGLPMTWFSVIRDPRPAWLGMDRDRQVIVSCDRMEVCYQVVPEDAHLIARWGDLKMDARFEELLPGARRLDGARGARPGLWGVTSHPVRVVRA
jgi:hypothetical protein